MEIKEGMEYYANQKKHNWYYQFRDLSNPTVEHIIGKYYNCIFDESKGKIDIKTPHQHKILDAFYIHRPGHIYHGLAIKLHDFGFLFNGKFIRAWLYGVDKKHIVGKINKEVADVTKNK